MFRYGFLFLFLRIDVFICLFSGVTYFHKIVLLFRQRVFEETGVMPTANALSAYAESLADKQSLESNMAMLDHPTFQATNQAEVSSWQTDNFVQFASSTEDDVGDLGTPATMPASFSNNRQGYIPSAITGPDSDMPGIPGDQSAQNAVEKRKRDKNYYDRRKTKNPEWSKVKNAKRRHKRAKLNDPNTEPDFEIWHATNAN